MSDLPNLHVGTMCHCDDPDDCDDHWEFFIDPVFSEWNPGNVRRGRKPTEADMRAIAALVQRSREAPDAAG